MKRFALPKNLARGLRHQTHDGFEQTRLACAIQTTNQQQVSTFHGQADIEQNLRLAITGIDILQLKHGQPPL